MLYSQSRILFWLDGSRILVCQHFVWIGLMHTQSNCTISAQYGQPIRLLLAHAGVEYEDKRYNIKGEAPNFDRSEWLADKFNLGLEFPNVSIYLSSLQQSSSSFVFCFSALITLMGMWNCPRLLPFWNTSVGSMVWLPKMKLNRSVLIWLRLKLWTSVSSGQLPVTTLIL